VAAAMQVEVKETAARVAVEKAVGKEAATATRALLGSFGYLSPRTPSPLRV
jgi:hypothetical protein